VNELVSYFRDVDTSAGLRGSDVLVLDPTSTSERGQFDG